jgi:hypothetical protein
VGTVAGHAEAVEDGDAEGRDEVAVRGAADLRFADVVAERRGQIAGD